MGFIFERRRRIHWLDRGAVACGAKLLRDEFPRLTTDGTRETALFAPVAVTCPKCIEAVKRRMRVLSDPGSDDEKAALDVLRGLLGK